MACEMNEGKRGRKDRRTEGRRTEGTRKEEKSNQGVIREEEGRKKGGRIKEEEGRKKGERKEEGGSTFCQTRTLRYQFLRSRLCVCYPIHSKPDRCPPGCRLAQGWAV